ncbi:MAG: DNA polymerase III subunit delta [Bacteroidetes bacterium]|nr:DNA polymerase III subunit delta [Bacteroidota bacterium]
MRFERLKSHLIHEKFAPCYFVYGEESFFIDEVGLWFEQVVISEDLRDFNQTILYGPDSSMSEVIERARQLPMMFQRTLVLVRQAQSLLRQLAELESYINHPNPQCVLVFLMHNSGLDRRKKVIKVIESHEGLYECKKLYENELAGFLDNELHRSGIYFEDKAKQLFLAAIGNDPRRVKSELEKIQLAQEGIKQIEVEHVEKYTGIHRTFNVFELQKAISTGKMDKASGILAFFADNAKDHPIQMTIPVLFSFFSKVFKYHAVKNKSEAAKALGVSPYFLKDYQTAARIYTMKRLTVLIADLKRIDLRSKGVGQLSSAHITAELYQALAIALIP